MPDPHPRHNASVSMLSGVEIAPDVVSICNDAILAEIIGRLDQVGEGYRAPLFRAARARQIAFSMAQGGRRIPGRVLNSTPPLMLVLGDDCPTATGPDGWSQARALMRWANAVLIHAAAGQAEHYEMAIAMTCLRQRVLVVECEARHASAWQCLAQRHMRSPRALSILPEGDVHPIPTGEALQ